MKTIQTVAAEATRVEQMAQSLKASNELGGVYTMTLKPLMQAENADEVWLMLKGEIDGNDEKLTDYEATIKTNNTAKVIHLAVDCLGGSVFEALRIRDVLRASDAKVIGHIVGVAASAATTVLTACDVVEMQETALQLIHKPHMVAIGNASELRQVADDLDKVEAIIKAAYMATPRNKMTQEELDARLSKGSFLTASECLALGLADHVTTAPVKVPQNAVKDPKNTLETMDGQIVTGPTEYGKTEAEEQENNPTPREEAKNEEAKNKASFIMAALKSARKEQ